METVTRQEIIEAAQNGRLTENGDRDYLWFEIDGRQTDIRPVQELIADRVLAYEITTGLPRKIVVR